VKSGQCGQIGCQGSWAIVVRIPQKINTGILSSLSQKRVIHWMRGQFLSESLAHFRAISGGITPLIRHYTTLSRITTTTTATTHTEHNGSSLTSNRPRPAVVSQP
jgi:hypothetical protein